MNTNEDKKSGHSSRQIWILTGFAVLVILGLAVGVSGIARKQGANDRPPETAESPTPYKAEAPPEQGAETPGATALQGGASVAPLVAIAPEKPPAPVDGRPALQLDRIAGTLSVSSPAAPAGGRLDLEHTCYRSGSSLPVLWKGAPAQTKTYVLALEERRDGEPPFVKWLMFNVPAASIGLPAGVPQAEKFEGGIQQGRNDHDSTGYTGPCIPQGQILYVLRLFALDAALEAPPTAKFDALIPLMNGHIVDAAEYKFYHYLKL